MQFRSKCIAALSLVVGVTAGASCRSSDPRFEDFAVSPGTRASGANFAGKLQVTSRGCGSPCQVNDIVSLEFQDTIATIPSVLGVEYRLDSRLLVVNSSPDLERWCELEDPAILTIREFYVATDSSLVLLQSRQVCDDR